MPLEAHCTTPGNTDYRGRRHARITRSMKALAPAHLRVLVELRYMLRDGESAAISNAALKRRTGYSEAYISTIMRQLAGESLTTRSHGQVVILRGCARPFIRRVWSDDHGGFVITMLAPPEVRGEAPRIALGDQPPEPYSEVPETAAARPETPQIGVQGADPPILLHAWNTPPQPPAGEQPRNGGGDALTREEPTATEVYLHSKGFGAAKEFRHLDFQAVRKEVEAHERTGGRPGGLVVRWRVCPPKPAQPAAPAYYSAPAPTRAPALAPDELRRLAAKYNPFARKE